MSKAMSEAVKLIFAVNELERKLVFVRVLLPDGRQPSLVFPLLVLLHYIDIRLCLSLLSIHVECDPETDEVSCSLCGTAH